MPTPNSAPRTGRDWRSLQSALARIMVAADDFADEVANSKGPLWLEFELRLAFRATAVDRYLSGSEGPVPQVPSALPPEVADHLVLWDLQNGKIEDAAYAHFDEHGGRRAGQGLQTDIEQYMMQFAEKRHGRSPVESLTREHAKNVIKRLTERAEI